MGTPHKHAAVIKAWADGAEIQCRLAFSDDRWQGTLLPSWLKDYEYRVNPNTVKYRLYWYATCAKDAGVFIGICQNKNHVSSLENSVNFKGWIGDWQEVEQPE